MDVLSCQILSCSWVWKATHSEKQDRSMSQFLPEDVSAKGGFIEGSWAGRVDACRPFEGAGETFCFLD